MSQPDARMLSLFDRMVPGLIVEKYGFTDLDAIRSFLKSETYQMLVDPATDVYTMSPYIVFALWESERVTGDPRNSAYIRG